MKVKKSRISKINTSLLVLTIVSILAITVSKAYFSAQAESADNIYVSGTLELVVTQDSMLTVNNWRPGDENTLEFTLENTGSLPVSIKGYFDGEWQTPGLDSGLFEIISAEVLVDDVWSQLANETLYVGQEFFVSANGMPDTIFVIQPQQQVEFLVTTRLSVATPDEYQNQEFVTSLHLAGKQVVEGSDWPAEY